MKYKKKCNHEVYEEIPTESVKIMASDGSIEDTASLFSVYIGLSLLENEDSKNKLDYFCKCIECGHITFEFSLKESSVH